MDMEKLIQRAKEREPEAFTHLMDLHMQGMYKTARAILQNDEDAADAIQDTILICWEKLSGLKENRYFKTWITRILINRCNEMLRKKKETAILEEMPEAAAVESEYDMEWKEALEAISEEYRLPVILYYGQGFHTKEIAAMLGITDAAVRTRLARARGQLRKYYREEE
ncbi:MAG: sigma-70 family RNA polymerase sigma factor [Butyrivibrio sp.]|nr:sigma-70 family RNA polymerase sigma factor [Butyrivibrio sp.]